MTKRKMKSTYMYNKTLSEYLGRWDRIDPDVEVGIEIEVEGENLPREPIKGWRAVPDGSLRGESAEYVFNGPAARANVLGRLKTLETALSKATVNQSYRTSVHVHINQRDVLLKDIYGQILLYTIWEDVLGELCGNERVGNLFALRAKDAEFYLEQLHRAVMDDYLSHLNTQDLRYTAVNPMALFVHGTLEYRSMRGTTDTKVIQEWVEYLLAIKDAARNVFSDPKSMIQDLSLLGPDEWALKIFTKEQIERFSSGWQEKIFEGARLVQYIAFANENDWEATPDKPVKAEKPPTYARYTITGNTNVARPDPDVRLNEILRRTTLAFEGEAATAQPQWVIREEEL